MSLQHQQAVTMNAAIHEMRAMLYHKDLELRRAKEIITRQSKEIEILRSRLDRFQSVFFMPGNVVRFLLRL